MTIRHYNVATFNFHLNGRFFQRLLRVLLSPPRTYLGEPFGFAGARFLRAGRHSCLPTKTSNITIISDDINPQLLEQQHMIDVYLYNKLITTAATTTTAMFGFYLTGLFFHSSFPVRPKTICGFLVQDFWQVGCPFRHPTDSVKAALKGDKLNWIKLRNLQVWTHFNICNIFHCSL